MRGPTIQVGLSYLSNESGRMYSVKASRIGTVLSGISDSSPISFITVCLHNNRMAASMAHSRSDPPGSIRGN